MQPDIEKAGLNKLFISGISYYYKSAYFIESQPEIVLSFRTMSILVCVVSKSL